MTFEDFIKKYDGQPIDYDGAWGNQCVDLYRQYVKEVLGYPQSPPVEGAKDIWNSYLPEYFKRIENTPMGVPEKGDVVIFGTTLGKYGHVSIFVEGTTSRFTSLDQNYPTGSLCHLQGHTYSAVIGWLTPLKKSMDIPEWLKTLLQEANLTLQDEGIFRAFWQKAKDYDQHVRELQEQVKSANEALSDRALEVSTLTEKVQKLSDRKGELEEEVNRLRGERDKATWEATQLGIKVEDLEDKNNKLREQITSFEENNNIYAYSFWDRFVSLLKRR